MHTAFTISYYQYYCPWLILPFASLFVRSFFGDSGVEAPVLFKRGDTYHAIFGACCCYCKSGKPVVAHTAASIMGPWTTLGPIDTPQRAECTAQHGRQAELVAFRRAMGLEEEVEGDSSCTERRGSGSAASNIHAQQTNVVTYYDGSGAPAFIWQGDG